MRRDEFKMRSSEGISLRIPKSATSLPFIHPLTHPSIVSVGSYYKDSNETGERRLNKIMIFELRRHPKCSDKKSFLASFFRSLKN